MTFISLKSPLEENDEGEQILDYLKTLTIFGVSSLPGPGWLCAGILDILWNSEDTWDSIKSQVEQLID